MRSNPLGLCPSPALRLINDLNKNDKDDSFYKLCYSERPYRIKDSFPACVEGYHKNMHFSPRKEKKTKIVRDRICTGI